MNALARASIEQHLEFKFTASKEASDWLGQQLAEQRTRVREVFTLIQFPGRKFDEDDSRASSDCQTHSGSP